MHQVLRYAGPSVKYPVANEQEHAEEMQRSLRMAGSHVSKGELVTAAMLGSGLPSTLSLYHLKRFKGGRAMKLKSAMLGADDEPPSRAYLQPLTKHKPHIFQHAFSGGPAAAGSNSRLVSHPHLPLDGTRGHNKRITRMTPAHVGDARHSTLGAIQHYQRTNGYRSLTKDFDLPSKKPYAEGHIASNSPAVQWVSEYIQQPGQWPMHHDDLVHRKLARADVAQHWVKLRELGLVSDDYVLRQQSLIHSEN